MHSKEQDSGSINWEKFERYFQHLFPTGIPEQKDQAWMKELFDTSISRSDSHAASAYLTQQPEVFETHRQVIIRISVRDLAQLDRMRIRMGEHSILLDGLGKEQIHVPLPAAVKPRTAKAVFREKVLQLTVHKRSKDTYYYEVPITY